MVNVTISFCVVRPSGKVCIDHSDMIEHLMDGLVERFKLRVARQAIVVAAPLSSHTLPRTT